MYESLASTLSDLASWLQSASQAFPISQLSLMSWLAFVVSGSLASKKAFNLTEQ